MILTKTQTNTSQSTLACPICYDEEKPSKIVRACDNNHLFHIDCIKTWGKKHIDCPTCREPMRTSITSTRNPLKYINTKVKTAKNNHVRNELKRADELATLKTKIAALPEAPLKAQATNLLRVIESSNVIQQNSKKVLLNSYFLPYLNVVTLPAAGITLAVSRRIAHDRQAQLNTLLSAN